MCLIEKNMLNFTIENNTLLLYPQYPYVFDLSVQNEKDEYVPILINDNLILNHYNICFLYHNTGEQFAQKYFVKKHFLDIAVSDELINDFVEMHNQQMIINQLINNKRFVFNINKIGDKIA